MYLLDSNAIITPFHKAQCSALSLALHHNDIKETIEWLKHWYTKGFSSGNLVITREVYDEVVKKSNRSDKSSRVEKDLLKSLHERGKIRLLEENEAFFNVLADIDKYVRSSYELHQAENFLRKADPMLVAIAKIHGATLVTEERHFIPARDETNGRIQGEPRLPFVSATFKVKCTSILNIMLAKHREWDQLSEHKDTKIVIKA
ncbi:DUF4411 family protein [Carboxydocella sp. ULO1]|uniref:DUF4411 family protein n=1 Tax=Carboxydocella sp. ULO1 TaxID=1926599 RepID=UPI0009AEA3B1|nr:DUF4411 family protein [Carboxydocella sp. ULO1]GAW28945.1 hypothetical protein ULO1_15150 [Carboxydocella sp. ULO1]